MECTGPLTRRTHWFPWYENMQRLKRKRVQKQRTITFSSKKHVWIQHYLCFISINSIFPNDVFLTLLKLRLLGLIANSIMLLFINPVKIRTAILKQFDTLILIIMWYRGLWRIRKMSRVKLICAIFLKSKFSWSLPSADESCCPASWTQRAALLPTDLLPCGQEPLGADWDDTPPWGSHQG